LTVANITDMEKQQEVSFFVDTGATRAWIPQNIAEQLGITPIGKDALKKGKAQLADYLDRMSLGSGYLLIFSRAKITDWDTVGKREKYEVRGKKIEVIYM
ncbi:aspartyl protease family protein, partial [Desulfococcaceae bacterium HSG8]|nr:aspartyl protease family protein [Desulfococcaceae bacterium HSG8]